MKRVVLALLAITFSASLFAQGKPGIIAGFTSSQLKIQDVDFKSRAGFQAGVAYNQPLALGFAIQPELIYNVKSSGIDVTEGEELNTKLSYVEIPVQLQWGIDLIAFKPYIFAEPFVGYAVSGGVKLDGPISLGKDFDLSKLKSRVEYGIGLGAGVNVLGKIQISAKYYWNLEDAEITSASEAFETIKASIKTGEQISGLVISAGFFF